MIVRRQKQYSLRLREKIKSKANDVKESLEERNSNAEANNQFPASIQNTFHKDPANNHLRHLRTRLEDKNYSLSPRTKAGLKGMGYGVGTSIGLGAAAGTLMTNGIDLKGKLALGLAATILSLPATLYAGYKSGVQLWDNEERKRLEPIEREQRLKEGKINQERQERLRLENIKNQLLKDFPEIEGLCKIALDKSLNKLNPEFGDGDEYPTFYLLDPKEYKSKDNFLYILNVHWQGEAIGINPQKGWWCLEDSPEKKINLKQYLFKYYKSELDYYIKAKREDNLCWEDWEYDQVINYIKKIIELVNKYLK